ncbi:MAG: hypothetical protein AB2417_06595 [Clostridiaceae bacterium]
MNNKFLHDLQEDIFDKKGYFILYVVVFIPTFIIDINTIQLYIDIFRIALSAIPLLLLILIYFKCKNSRNEKENKIIIQVILIFLILTFGSIHGFIRNFNSGYWIFSNSFSYI